MGATERIWSDHPASLRWPLHNLGNEYSAGVGVFSRRDLARILELKGHISTDGYLRFCDGLDEVKYAKRDFLFKSGEWRDAAVERSFPRLMPSNLVLGHSDIPTKRIIVRLLQFFGVNKLLGTNVAEVPGVSAALPLGLTNDCDDSPRHRILGDTQPILMALSESSSADKAHDNVLLSFNETTAPKHRSEAVQLLRNQANVTEIDLDYSVHGRLSYVRAICGHEFVVCPPGNGVDTHRFWETLYCGSTPIVKRGQIIDPLLKQYPVWIVDDWEEVLDPVRRTETRLRLMDHEWDISKLTQSFWNSFIRNFVST